MKKIILFVFCTFFLLTGCQLGNTPTSKVEALLSKYQMLEDDIFINYTDLSKVNVTDTDFQKRYQKLIQNQYKNLSYEVKEEEIDGENAVVTVQIEVLNYQDVFEKYNASNYDDTTYHENVLKDLESAKEKITYTIEFEVVLTDSGDWEVSPLDSEELQKLLGMYSG